MNTNININININISIQNNINIILLYKNKGSRKLAIVSSYNLLVTSMEIIAAA
jgi:hypothetical protein